MQRSFHLTHANLRVQQNSFRVVASFIASAFVFSPVPVLSQAAPPAPAAPPSPTVRAVRAQGSIRLDGQLDENGWRNAPVADVFTQIEPSEASPSSQRTEVRLVYDDQALYIGVRLHDTGHVIARLGRRDMPLGDSDWFSVLLDSYHDHRTAFGFDVNPLGVRRDEVRTIDQDDNTWDPVWDVATSTDSAGWTAEFRIPFSQLRFSGAKDQTWGVQFERRIGRLQELSVSTYIPRAERGGVPRYGHLEGLTSLQAGKRLELLPYVVERAEYVNPGANPFRTDHDLFTSGGLDAVVRASSNVTINATFNPDFGQVEVDPAVVNLGVYEVFFDEKRPFFIEGSEIFNFGANGTSGGQIFYSRRIGRAPSLAPPTNEADVPNVTTILGAAKLSGKVAGWSVGLLEAVTDRERAHFRIAPGESDWTIVEPRANYLVARARRESGGGATFLGGVVTAVNRSLETPTLVSTLRSAGYAAGVDFRHEFGDRKWVIEGDAEGSDVRGSARAIALTQRQSNHFFQRPDASYLPYDTTATALRGYSINASLSRQSGTHWRGALAGALTSPGYEVNDLGFARRTDRRDAQATLTYVENRPGPAFRRWSATFVGRSEHNFDGDPILSVITLNSAAQTLGYWTLRANVSEFLRAFDDRLTRGGPMAQRPSWLETDFSLSSDVRKPVTLDLAIGAERHEHGGHVFNGHALIGVKTSSRWNLSMGPSLTRLYTPAQYLTTVVDSTYTATFGRRYLFAPLHQTEIGIESRLNVTFTPRLSLETYVQPLLSSGDYGRGRQLQTPRSFAFIPAANTPEPDFNLRSLRGNAVLRWEWREGSTIYFAWQQSRSDIAPYGDFSFGRDRRALFNTPPDNIFLVKMNFWLNP